MFNSLPEPIKREILSLLPRIISLGTIISDIRQYSLVSKEWREIFMNKITWSLIYRRMGFLINPSNRALYFGFFERMSCQLESSEFKIHGSWRHYTLVKHKSGVISVKNNRGKTLIQGRIYHSLHYLAQVTGNKCTVYLDDIDNECWKGEICFGGIRSIKESSIGLFLEGNIDLLLEPSGILTFVKNNICLSYAGYYGIYLKEGYFIPWEKIKNVTDNDIHQYSCSVCSFLSFEVFSAPEFDIIISTKGTTAYDSRNKVVRWRTDAYFDGCTIVGDLLLANNDVYDLMTGEQLLPRTQSPIAVSMNNNVYYLWK